MCISDQTILRYYYRLIPLWPTGQNYCFSIFEPWYWSQFESWKDEIVSYVHDRCFSDDPQNFRPLPFAIPEIMRYCPVTYGTFICNPFLCWKSNVTKSISFFIQLLRFFTQYSKLSIFFDEKRISHLIVICFPQYAISGVTYGTWPTGQFLTFKFLQYCSEYRCPILHLMLVTSSVNDYGTVTGRFKNKK